VVRLTRSRYWVPRIKNLVKAVVNSCKVCVIHKKRLQVQMMRSFPKERMSFPFRSRTQGWTTPARLIYKIIPEELVSLQKGMCWFSFVMYVDDVLSLADSAADAKFIVRELQIALDSAGFSLKKWASNHKEILAHIQSYYLLTTDFLEIDTESPAKTLGVRRKATSDELFFVPPDLATEISPTKCQVLSQITKLFDPAGWLVPFVVCAKIFMQEIWLQDLGRDDKIPIELNQRWNSFLRSYSVLDQVRIHRWVSFRPEFRVEHHGFCDSSQKAYGAAIYVRVEVGHKTMAPVKTVSLPRLELCEALLLSEMAQAILLNMA